jgi:NTE family protein
LIANAEQRVLHRGDVLMREGEPSDALYFVISGRFVVEREGDGSPLAEIGQGQPIGEIGFFGNLPRTATVRALRDSNVLTITRTQFQKLSAVSPRSAMQSSSHWHTGLRTPLRSRKWPRGPVLWL